MKSIKEVMAGMGSVYRGSMPEPGGEIDEDALIMGWEEIGVTEAQVRHALPFVRDKFTELMYAGSSAEAKQLLAQAIIDHPLP